MVIQLKPVVVVDSAKLKFIKSYTSTHNDRPPRGGFSDLDIVNKAERRYNRVLKSKARFSKIFNSHTFKGRCRYTHHPPKTYLCEWMMALKAKPFLQLEVKSFSLTTPSYLQTKSAWLGQLLKERLLALQSYTNVLD